MTRDDLLTSMSRLLGSQPGLTARALANALWATDRQAVDKSQVNSVLYRHPELFQNDGTIPPGWSLVAKTTPEVVQERSRYCVSAVGVENWKVFEKATIRLVPITLVFGENSSGKSSIMQALHLMKQSWGHGDLQFDGQHGRFGWYQHVVHRHDVNRELMLSAFWEGADDGGSDLLILRSSSSGEEIGNLTSQLESIACTSGGNRLAFTSTNAMPLPGEFQRADSWMAFSLGEEGYEDAPVTSPLAAEGLVLGSDDNGFPNLDDVVDVVRVGGASPHLFDDLVSTDVLRVAFDDVAKMFASLEHIGPVRTVPERGISLFWARKHADYLARLFYDQQLLDDVNEWLGKFDVPYELGITRYGADADGDESFELDLTRIGGASERVQLSDVGFGISQLLPIVVKLLASREKTILIEEPEAHLHPRLQSVLGDLFVTSIQDYGNVLLVETHSEPILLRLQRRIAEQRIDPSDIGVLHVVRRGESSRIEEIEIQDNGQLDYQWPGGFFDDRMDDLVAILDPRPDE